MGKIIVAFGLAGWAAIVAVAYRMADKRIALCHFTDTPCLVRTTAARDYTLTAGLAVALAFILICLAVAAFVAARRFTQPARDWQPTNRAPSPRLR